MWNFYFAWQQCPNSVLLMLFLWPLPDPFLGHFIMRWLVWFRHGEEKSSGIKFGTLAKFLQKNSDRLQFPPLVVVWVLQASLLVALWSSYPYHFGPYGFSQVVKLGTHHFSNPLVLHLNILGSRMKVWILGKMNDTLVVSQNILYFSCFCPNSCEEVFRP